MYITKYGCVFLKLGESTMSCIYVALGIGFAPARP